MLPVEGVGYEGDGAEPRPSMLKGEAMRFDLASAGDLTAQKMAHPPRELEETVFVAYPAARPSMRWNGTLTPTCAELAAQSQVTRTPVRLGTQESVTDNARDARVTLLARRYERPSTVEDDARLAILTVRLRKLSPRVTAADLDKLTTMVDELEHVASNLEEIRSKFRVPC